MAEEKKERKPYQLVLNILEDPTIQGILKQLIAHMMIKTIEYLFSSLTIKATEEEIKEINEKFPMVKVLFNGDIGMNEHWLWEKNWEDYDGDIFLEAAKNIKTNNFEFYTTFEKIFRLTATGALGIREKDFKQIQIFAVTHSSVIKLLSGVQTHVPKFRKGDRQLNQYEMMMLFISAYPAYCNYCRNSGNTNRFWWNYQIYEMED